MLPTLRDLCRSLGDDLRPAGPGEVPAVEVTAVHVSDLADPTPFLDGGELLLTTGLGWQPSLLWLGGYVRRLAGRGVAALALGIGPVHAAVPPGLPAAAAAAGLPLLVVPAPTPFLAVSRCYWSMIAESGQRELAQTLSAHRSLVAASLGEEPVPAVLRRLAVAIGGWTAHLAPDGRLRSAWPAGRRGTARELQAAVRRLNAVGAPTSLSLPLGPDDVVVQPIGDSRLLGYLAIGHPRPLPRPAQQLAMTAVALLTLESIHAGRLRLAARTSEAMILGLLCAGEVAAARQAAGFLGLNLPDRVRVALIGGTQAGQAQAGGRPGGGQLQPGSGEPAATGDPDEVLLRLDALPAAGHLILAGRDPGEVAACAVLVRDAPGTADWLARLITPGAGASVVLAGPVDLDQVAGSARRARAALADAAPGELADLGGHASRAPLDTPRLRAWAQARLAPLAGEEHLAETVVAVLRRRSEQDAARDLGVHRHTVRHRVTRAQSLLGASLDDPDVRADLWLALRLAGRC
ncbi:MAG TPA: PucR family transcriptional regulator ligand-binding domain-containing protein [Trebonia sp.]|jgi:purine catabolism regulator|nr:PucR family transcriptional regulator ligand-binding domain-containing protein [Trebonia sp.]